MGSAEWSELQNATPEGAWKKGENDDEPFALRKKPREKPTNANQRKVYIWVNIFSINGVDQALQQFDAHFHLKVQM